MLDVVALAMIAIVPVLAFSIYQVIVRRNYALHKKLQLALGIVLLVAVTIFEVDVRMHGWRHRAEASPYSGHDGATNWVMISLAIHLFFAVTAAVLWILVIVRAAQLSAPARAGPA